MQYRLYAPKAIDCVINLPASKSISNRALVINALSGSKEVPENLSDCDDTDVMVAALRDMPYESSWYGNAIHLCPTLSFGG